MAAKKMPQKAETKEEAAKKTPQETKQENSPSIEVRIDRMVDYVGSSVKAFASANIGGAFAIHGIKVIDSEKGLFVSMPQTRYEKDGKMKYSDIFHAITADARTELNHAVLDAYEIKLGEDMVQGQGTDSQLEEENPFLGQAM